jgi:endonuclease/exonuclease/phosphatase family metal-dependent hydrolase
MAVQSEQLFGQSYQAGATEAPGQAPGFEAELLVGPLGSSPLGEGRCWRAVPATFNVQAGNNDEYSARVALDMPGLFGLAYRYRPAGGAWLYGDRFGADDGFDPLDVGVLFVAGEEAAPLVVATLNLRCRTDDWAAREPLVVAALARIRPDLVAFQEDCALDGRAQVADIAAALGTHTQRGYAFVRFATHTANHPDGDYEEGISVMSAHPIEAVGSFDLPSVLFQRKAAWIDVTVRGQALRFLGTHLDVGPEAGDVRTASAAQILTVAPTDRAFFVAGDMNAGPSSPPIDLFSGALVDLWSAANPLQPGLTYPASAPIDRIDWIFASDTVAVDVIGARQLDESLGATLLSDHFGVAAALED